MHKDLPAHILELRPADFITLSVEPDNFVFMKVTYIS